jgi:uncharacterized protein (TIGR00369 family)
VPDAPDVREDVIALQEFLGLRVVRRGSPSQIELDLTPQVRGAVAPLHGGALATLMDVACGFAAAAHLTESTQIPVSTEVTVRFLRQPKSSPLVAEAEVVHAGRSAMIIDCVVRDGQGNQVGRGTGSYRIIDGFHDLGSAPA